MSTFVSDLAALAAHTYFEGRSAQNRAPLPTGATLLDHYSDRKTGFEASVYSYAGKTVILFAQVRSDGAARDRAHRDQIAQEDATRERAVGELAAARETLSKLERTQRSCEQSAEAYEKLATEKLVGSLDAEEKRRNAV